MSSTVPGRRTNGRQLPWLTASAVIWATVLGVATAAAQQTVPPGARLAWTQEGMNENQARGLRFTLYVDGVASSLGGVTCHALAGVRAVECAAPLPYLSPGRHVLQLSSRQSTANAASESARSEPFHVIVPDTPDITVPLAGGSSTASRQEPPASGAFDVDVELVASGVTLPTDIAIAPDGSVFLAECGGTLRLIRNGVLHTEAVHNVAEASSAAGGALLSVALDPLFSDNGFVYLAYAMRSSETHIGYQVARFRYAAGALGERVVLLDRINADPNRLSAVVRAADDGTLTIAFGDTNLGERNIRSSYSGKVLRLDRNGTTPRDHTAMSPIIALGVGSPRGLVWDDASKALWLLDRPENATQINVITDFSDTGSAASHTLTTENAEGMALYRGRAISGLDGHLLFATADGVQASSAHISSAVNTAMLSVAGRQELGSESARAVALAPTGDVYVATATKVFRLSPRH
jgi:hypothetical protein